jgi:hypothetical protein
MHWDQRLLLVVGHPAVITGPGDDIAPGEDHLCRCRQQWRTWAWSEEGEDRHGQGRVVPVNGVWGSAYPVILFSHVFCVVQAITNYRIFAYPSKVEVIPKT